MFRPHRCDFDIHSDFLDSPGLDILHSWDIIVFQLCLHLAASQCDSTSPRLSRLTRPSISTSASTSPRLPRSLSSSIFSYPLHHQHRCRVRRRTSSSHQSLLSSLLSSSTVESIPEQPPQPPAKALFLYSQSSQHMQMPTAQSPVHRKRPSAFALIDVPASQPASLPISTPMRHVNRQSPCSFLNCAPRNINRCSAFFTSNIPRPPQHAFSKCTISIRT